MHKVYLTIHIQACRHTITHTHTHTHPQIIEEQQTNKQRSTVFSSQTHTLMCTPSPTYKVTVLSPRTQYNKLNAII